MREQHVQSNFAPTGILFRFRRCGYELRNDGCDRGFEIQQSALVEEHRHGGRRYDFGNGSEIKERRRSYGKIPTLSHRTREGWGTRRIGFIGEVTEGFEGDEFAAMGDGDRSSRESVLSNRF